MICPVYSSQFVSSHSMDMAGLVAASRSMVRAGRLHAPRGSIGVGGCNGGAGGNGGDGGYGGIGGGGLGGGAAGSFSDATAASPTFTATAAGGVSISCVVSSAKSDPTSAPKSNVVSAIAS